jgi:aspartate carbamoyltransferase catalytic subunit
VYDVWLTFGRNLADPAAAEAAKGSYVITAQTLTRAKTNMILMHPLPRVDEIHEVSVCAYVFSILPRCHSLS